MQSKLFQQSRLYILMDKRKKKVKTIPNTSKELQSPKEEKDVLEHLDFVSFGQEYLPSMDMLFTWEDTADGRDSQTLMETQSLLELLWFVSSVSSCPPCNQEVLLQTLLQLWKDALLVRQLLNVLSTKPIYNSMKKALKQSIRTKSQEKLCSTTSILVIQAIKNFKS